MSAAFCLVKEDIVYCGLKKLLHAKADRLHAKADCQRFFLLLKLKSKI